MAFDGEQKYKKLEIECARCKTRFEIWLSQSDIENGITEEAIRKHLHNYCPVCKELEKLQLNQRG